MFVGLSVVGFVLRVPRAVNRLAVYRALRLPGLWPWTKTGLTDRKISIYSFLSGVGDEGLSEMRPALSEVDWGVQKSPRRLPRSSLAQVPRGLVLAGRPAVLLEVS